MIITSHAIFCIIWPSGLNIGIITLIYVICVSYGSITRRNYLISFYAVLYASQVQPFLRGR